MGRWKKKRSRGKGRFYSWVVPAIAVAALALVLVLVLFPRGSRRVYVKGFRGQVRILEVGWEGTSDLSGIVYNPRSRTLFLVSDAGVLYEAGLDGAQLREQSLGNRDLEGITCDPASGRLYIAEEGPELLLEVDHKTLRIRRQFRVARTFKGKLLLPPGGNGFEAVTFVSRKNHPEGGYFLLANQCMDLKHDKEPPVIIRVDAPLRSSRAAVCTVPVTSYSNMDIVDISGMHYEMKSDRLYLISDLLDRLYIMERNLRLVSEYALPGRDQEGITVDEKGFLHIVQDSGGMLKLRINQGNPARVSGCSYSGRMVGGPEIWLRTGWRISSSASST